MDTKKNVLTLEELFNRAKNSQAGSPEAAAAKVLRIGDTSPAYILTRSDIDALNDFTGEYWDDDDVGVDHYRDFCPVFKKSMNKYMTTHEQKPWKPVYGTRLTNAIVTLALAFIDCSRTERREGIYYRMRMTLDDYFGAVINIGGSEQSGMLRSTRETAGKEYDLSMPLGEALYAILKKYIGAWKKLDYTRCVLASSNIIEVYRRKNGYPEAETANIFDDAADYEPLAADRELSVNELRGNIYLPDISYSPIMVRRAMYRAKNDVFRDLIETTSSDEIIAEAMAQVSSTAELLFTLLVFPYLGMRSPE